MVRDLSTPTRLKMLKDAVEYETDLFDGRLSSTALRINSGNTGIAHSIRKKYNEVRKQFGLGEIFDFDMKPERDQLIWSIYIREMANNSV